MATARTVWKGSIQASVLMFPIKFYNAINKSDGVHFNQLCPDCHVKIKQSMACPSCSKALTKSEVLHGYPIGEQFVILSDEEIDQAHKEKVENIPILNFVDQGEINLLYNDEPYFITPDKAGQDIFQIFRQSLVETNKTALGKIILRSKEHLIDIAPFPGSNILIGYGLRFHEDLKALTDIPNYDFTQKQIDPEMMKLAKQLVTNLSGKFEPEKYRDEYKEIIMATVEAKSKGIVIQTNPKKEMAKVTNLMDALKQAVTQTVQATA